MVNSDGELKMKIAVGEGERFVKLPDFIIAGTAKAGTTSIYYYLKNNPKIFFPKIKEPRFFSYGQYSHFDVVHPLTNEVLPDHLTSFMDYIKLFEKAPDGTVLGEASTQYLYDYKKVHKNLSKFYGNAVRQIKIIAILRNPVDRAWSNYSMHRNEGKEPLSFMDAIREDVIAERMASGWPIGYDYIGFGKYYEQLKFWHDNYENIKVFLYEDLEDPKKMIIELSGFLGVDPYLDFDVDRKFNVSGVPKNELFRVVSDFVFKKNQVKNFLKKVVPAQARYKLRTAAGSYLYKKDSPCDKSTSLLKDIYREDLLNLQKLLNRQLDGWMA